MQALMIQYITEHSRQYTIAHLNSLHDEALLDVYNDVRDTVISFEEIGK